MIVDKDTSPKRKIYYLGAKVLEVIVSENKSSFDFFSVFESLNKKEKTSIGLFNLTLDWLFLLGAIKLENKSIKKCF